MRIDILTLFVEMCERVLDESIIGRARKNGYIDVRCHNIRDYTEDKHRRVDDYSYGHGKGMVMQPDPIFKCHRAVCEQLGEKPHTIYMSPQGTVLTQKRAEELSKLPNIIVLCGHYEGVDERVLEEIVDEEISIGDYVLTGGELPALVMVDAIARMCDGVLAASECYEEESHYNGLLEYPQYTHPQEWHGKEVPPVLLSGNHKEIREWRQIKRLERTKQKRPDMMERYQLTKEDQKLLESLKKAEEAQSE